MDISAAQITIDELKRDAKRLEPERDAARKRGEELAAEENGATRVDRMAQELEEFAASIRDGVNDLDFQGVSSWSASCRTRGVIGNEIAIEHAIPLSGRLAGLRSHHWKVLTAAVGSRGTLSLGGGFGAGVAGLS